MTKHYYSGSQRVATRLSGNVSAFNAADQEDLGYQGDDLDDRQFDDINHTFDYFNLDHPGIWNVPGLAQACGHGEEVDEQCVCVFQHNCNDGILYFFHSDHLGTSTFLTDATGEPYQFFLNLPFGETMEEQFALSPKWWSTPYLFNGKELDSRTSLYYYVSELVRDIEMSRERAKRSSYPAAQRGVHAEWYYDPGISGWLSVDPKAADSPDWTPYRYAFNNPVRIIDPDGQFETRFGAWLYNASQGFKGKVHKSESRPGEYYVGRQILSSNEARYDIKWSGNSERPGGGLVNALDKTPQLAKTLKKHVSNVLPSPTKGERSGDFGANRDEFNLHLGLLFSKGRAKNITNRISYLECLKIVKKVKSPAIHVAF